VLVGWWLLFLRSFVVSLLAACCIIVALALHLGLSRSLSRISLISGSLTRSSLVVVVIVIDIVLEIEEMEDDTLDRDARIKLSIGTKDYGEADAQFNNSSGLVFDHHRGLLLVVDSGNHRVQVFSCDDDDNGGSFVSKFGAQGNGPGQFRLQYPWGIAIDHDHDRILVANTGNNRIQSWSLSDQSFLSCIGQRDIRCLGFAGPQGIAIDKHHHRIVMLDFNNDRLVFLSSIDLSFLFSVGHKRRTRPGDFYYPSGIAIDHDRHRIIVSESKHNRVRLWSIDGSFLFQFGEFGKQPGKFMSPKGVCVDNHGRIIVADTENYRLQAFTHEGHHISSFHCGYARPCGVAFDEHRGLIAFSTGNRVHVIGANQWLADTFTWRPDRHRYAPSWMKQAVSTMTMIRSLVDESAMSMIPNELLFEIFSFL